MVINPNAMKMSQVAGSFSGQAVAWNHAHNQNKRSGGGFFARMGRHAGWNIVGGLGGSVAGTAGYLGYKALRRGK